MTRTVGFIGRDQVLQYIDEWEEAMGDFIPGVVKTGGHLMETYIRCLMGRITWERLTV